MGYSSGRKSSSLNVPASYGDYIRDNKIEQVKLNRMISYMCIYIPLLDYDTYTCTQGL